MNRGRTWLTICVIVIVHGIVVEVLFDAASMVKTINAAEGFQAPIEAQVLETEETSRSR